MTKHYVDDKAMERRKENDRNKAYDINEKRYDDSEDPSMRKEFPGEEIVDDLRELSRQDEQKDDDPTFLSGENVEHEKDRQRYGDSISKTADKEFQQRNGKTSSGSQNKSNH